MSMDHTMAAGSLSPVPPGTIPHPEHGTWEGHILPGSFFILWASWSLSGNYRTYLQSGVKRPYQSRSWIEFPSPGSKYPIEPFLKVLFPFIGINAELWAGHVSYRRMYDPTTGRFEQGNLQDWQHAAMYSAFMISGFIDLLGFYLPSGVLPQGTEHGFLGVSLLVEGLLFAFHLKGTALDMRLHLILVLIILSSAFICFLEIQYPRSFLLSTVRSQLMLLQGLWFYQIASILFEDNPAWDPTVHSSVMMVPFFLVVWIMAVTVGSVVLYVGLALLLKTGTYQQLARDEEGWAGVNGHPRSLLPELELNNSVHRQ